MTETNRHSTAAGPKALREALSRLAEAEDSDIDLADTALVLSALKHPSIKVEDYRTHLRDLVSSVGEAAAAQGGDMDSAADRARVLTEVMVGRWNYRGDSETYEDPQNADLIRVIDRRKGLPVTLGILWLHAARGQGWEAHGLNFPGHFLVRLDTEAGDRIIIDPFHDGQQVGVADLRALLKAVSGPAAELTPDTYAPVGNRDILLRLQNNVKLRQLESGQLSDALEAVTAMLLFAPRDHRLWRERGLMHMRLGDLESAIVALDRYLELAPPGQDREKIEQVMRELRHRLH